ncbi:outer membrane protein TolC [Ulvibacter sp. MAR_2010_11]|uniref:TolC family protein n=1 Tax=Ulvibacter sp. MAR_2010_11 TaxID=1250229 RepID=UPI000C2C25F4|nr:TolC family protein [Ulvibacter sp. MAR_2010_11]PKA81937.1 outer membrane protein TolC [Ulvibacter sp. MAR_2010_11]
MNTRIKLLLFVISYTLFVSCAFSQEESISLTLEEAVNIAIENNTNLNKAKIDEQIVQAQIAEVKGRALPQISGSGQFSDNFSLATQQLPGEFFGGEPGTTVDVAFGNRYNLTAGVNVQQQLLDFQLFNSVRAAKALETLQELQTLQTTEDLIINVVQVYIQIQVTEKQIQLLQENYNRTNSLVELSDAKYEEGIIRKLDLNQLIVNRSNLNTQIEDVRFTRNEQVRLLNLYLNIPISTSVTLTEKLEDRAPYPIEEGLNVASNIQFQQMEQQLDLALLDEKQVKSRYLPTLSAYFNYNYQGNSNELTVSSPDYQDQWNGNWGLTASIPIFDGFQRSKQLQQKQLTTKKLEEDKINLNNSIQKAYEDAKEQLLLSNTQIESQQSNMELAKENYAGIKLSYNEGVADLTELLDAEFALQQAQSNYLNALLQSKVAELTLLKANGQLSKLITQN